MPLYFYRCKCGAEFTQRRGLESSLSAVCATCKRTCRPVIQPAEVIFKGDGFTGAMRGRRPNSPTS